MAIEISEEAGVRSLHFGLDRSLVIAEKSGVPPLIVVNKLDLKNMDVFQETFQPYLDFPPARCDRTFANG